MPLTTTDRLAIHELVSLHGHLADDRRSDDLGLLLTPEASYDVTAYDLGGSQGCRRSSSSSPPHPATNPSVTTSPT